MKTNQLLLGGGIVALIYILYKKKKSKNGSNMIQDALNGDLPEVSQSDGDKGTSEPVKGSPTKPVIKTGGVKPPRPTKPIVPTKPTKLPPIKPIRPTKPTTKPPLTKKSYTSFSMSNINSELGI